MFRKRGKLHGSLLNWLVLLAFAFAGLALAQQDEGEQDAAGEQEGAGDAAAAQQAEPRRDEGRNWYLSMFDENDDGMMTVNEFGTAIYDLLVGDADGMDEGRYYRVLEVLGLEREDHPFESVDLNHDGLVSDDQEFIPAVASHVFAEWNDDEGGPIVVETIRDNLFAAADQDGDGMLDEEEFSLYATILDVSWEEYAGGTDGVTRDKFLTPRSRPDQDR